MRPNTGFGHPAESDGRRLTDVNEGRVTRKFESLPLCSATILIRFEREFEDAAQRRFKKTAACNACFRLLCMGSSQGAVSIKESLVEPARGQGPG